MLTVNEVSKLTGVTIRTLHYYDQIGLLSPARRTPSGSRLYGEAELARLQSIMLLRELDFSLGQIAEFMQSPSFDGDAALDEQIRLLEMKKTRLEGMIAHARELRKKGEKLMDFSSFDRTEMEGYKEEARRRWQGTEAYAEYEKRGPGDDAERGKTVADRLMDVFREFGEIRNEPANSEKAFALVKKLQDAVTRDFYTCTDSILAGLGQMYVCDERFKRNIDGSGGEGTAQFVSRAIAEYLAGSGKAGRK